MKRLLLLPLLCLPACSQCDPAKATPDAVAAAEARSDAAPKAAPDKPAEPAKALDIGQLFPPQPGLPVALEGFDFALDKAALTAKFPAAVTEAGAPVDGFPGVVAKVHFYGKSDTPRFAAVLLTADLAKALQTLWGEGTSVKGPGGNDRYWIGAGQKTQYVLAGNTFAVWPVVDWRELLGSDLHFAFEKPERLLLGATPDQIKEAYGHLRPRELRGDRMELRFGPQPLRTSPTRVLLTLADGVVNSVRVKLHHARKASPRTAMHTELTAKFGAPKTDTNSHQTYEIDLAGGKAKVEVADLEVTGFLSIEVSRLGD